LVFTLILYGNVQYVAIKYIIFSKALASKKFSNDQVATTGDLQFN